MLTNGTAAGTEISGADIAVVGAGGTATLVCAHGSTAGIGRAIGIAIITLLAGLDYAVVAFCVEACVGTGIGVHQIAVVAFLTCIDCTVAAAGESAVVGACIRIIGVAIITRFDACMDESVAARSFRAGVGTVVGIVCVAVIARFHTHMNNVIATGGDTAIVQADIGVVRIPIVARLAGPDDTVSTNGWTRMTSLQ